MPHFCPSFRVAVAAVGGLVAVGYGQLAVAALGGAEGIALSLKFRS
jgi:hypothetical protein